MMEEQFEAALDECEVAIHLFQKDNLREFEKKASTNVSSLLQLKGRILAGLGKRMSLYYSWKRRKI